MPADSAHAFGNLSQVQQGNQRRRMLAATFPADGFRAIRQAKPGTRGLTRSASTEAASFLRHLLAQLDRQSGHVSNLARSVGGRWLGRSYLPAPLLPRGMIDNGQEKIGRERAETSVLCGSTR
jgi:hypothetical protein